MKKNIQGRIVFIDLEGGFWGIETTDNKYQPLNMPEQLKYPGKEVNCTIKLEDVMTFQNWGQPCSIIVFKTIYP